LSYLVAQRSREFGVRMALGARWSDVQRLVLGEAARLVVVGLALGVGVALAMSPGVERDVVWHQIDGSGHVSLGRLRTGAGGL
jgi:ABC-type lipoprotein release transport system permease subunit